MKKLLFYALPIFLIVSIISSNYLLHRHEQFSSPRILSIEEMRQIHGGWQYFEECYEFSGCGQYDDACSNRGCTNVEGEYKSYTVEDEGCEWCWIQTSANCLIKECRMGPQTGQCCALKYWFVFYNCLQPRVDSFEEVYTKRCFDRWVVE